MTCLQIFLKESLNCKALRGQRIGLVFLINDTVADATLPEIIQEDRQIADFFSAIQTGKPEQMDSLPFDQRYKTIAKQIAENKEIEVRFDYLSKCPSLHLGKLDRHLTQLTKSFKADAVSETSTICHFMDMDTVFPHRHIELLESYYQDLQHEANMSN